MAKVAETATAKTAHGGAPRGRWIWLGSGFLRKKTSGIGLGDFQEGFPEEEKGEERPGAARVAAASMAATLAGDGEESFGGVAAVLGEGTGE